MNRHVSGRTESQHLADEMVVTIKTDDRPLAGGDCITIEYPSGKHTEHRLYDHERLGLLLEHRLLLFRFARREDGSYRVGMDMHHRWMLENWHELRWNESPNDGG